MLYDKLLPAPVPPLRDRINPLSLTCFCQGNFIRTTVKEAKTVALPLEDTSKATFSLHPSPDRQLSLGSQRGSLLSRRQRLILIFTRCPFSHQVLLTLLRGSCVCLSFPGNPVTDLALCLYSQTSSIINWKFLASHFPASNLLNRVTYVLIN